jgi:glycopeptide antibiotics resistance protein
MKKTGHSPHDPLLKLCRYGFYLSVLLLLYGTLFPFHFDFSSQNLRESWANASLLPYWDAGRGRIPSIPDMVSNVLLTMPLGFFGFLWLGRNNNPQRCARWFAVGALLGLLSEMIQLGISQRVSGVTDVLNNGLGALFGAIAASLYGAQILDLFSGSLYDRKHTSLLLLLAIVIAGVMMPFDLGMDIGQMKHSLGQLWRNPWELGRPIEDEWIQLVEFAMLGALAGSMNRKLLVSALLLPFILEPMQMLVESHSPSIRDLTMNFAGVLGGIVSARLAPGLVRPMTGFILLNLAIIAQGLSPYRFVAWESHLHFEWIPLVEYYYQTTSAALNDAMSGFLTYALLAALWPRRITILWAILLAASLEAAQLLLPARFSGTTDIVIAAIGACAGYAVSRAAAFSTDASEAPHPDIVAS